MTPNSGTAGARRDIAAEITAKILADLEHGVMPWRKPWDGARTGAPLGLPQRATGELYRGVNIVLLWIAAAEAGYRSRHWFSFRQAAALGASVRKGERGETVVYYGRAHRERIDVDGAVAEDKFRFLRSYVVFNAAQIDGLPDRFFIEPVAAGSLGPIGWHEAWFAKLDIARIVTADRACYIPSKDVIGMPPIGAFDSTDLYAQTLDHEAVHATAAPHRLARDYAKRYPKTAYAVEEITAELGAAFLGAHLGLPPGHINDHSAYIGDWIRALRDDRRAFLEAAGKAQAAVDWLLAKSPPPTFSNQVGIAHVAA
ncbi:MAG: zincin-like metallopeptidase domain-containing protein [Alphaproteobacteria bacterium]|nr:zincin-like metallopeptidase domain-containing protein [Alphaproteobacteria bacterium]